MPAQDKVAVRNPQGEIVYLSRSDLAPALHGGGFSPVSNRELAAKIQDVEDTNAVQGFLPTVGAGLAGAASTLTGGLSNFAIEKAAEELIGKGAGDTARRRLAKLEEEHPYATGVGNVLGFVGPLVATGGTSAFAQGALRGLGAIPRATVALGELASGAVGKKLGASLAGRAAAGVAGGAAEGAVMGLGNAIHEQSLSEHPELTAERILPHILSGMVFGGAVGGALPVAGAALSKASQGAKELAAKVTGSASIQGAREKLATKLEEVSKNRAFSSLKPSVKAYEKADTYYPGGSEELGGVWRDWVKETGKSVLSDEEAIQLAAKKSTENGKLVDKSLERFRKFPSQFQPKFEDVSGMFDDIVKHYEKQAGGQPMADAIRSLSDDVLSKMKPDKNGLVDPRKMWKLRKDVDKNKAFRTDSNNPAIGPAAAREVRTGVETYITELMQAAEEKFGYDVSSSYLAGKQGYQAAELLLDMAKKGATRGKKNRQFSLTDTGATLTGVMSGIVTGNPLLSPLMGAGLGAANWAMRNYGDQVASRAAANLSKMVSVDKVAAQSAKEMSQGVQSFVTGKGIQKVAAPTASMFSGETSADRRKGFEQYAEKLKDRVANPQRNFEQIAQRLGPVAEALPEVTSQVIQKQAANDAYLMKKLASLKGAQPSNDTLLPNKDKPIISDAEVAQFGQHVAVAEHGPAVLIDEMRRDSVSPDTVEAVKAMYPHTFDQLKKEILQAATELQNDLPFKKKQQITSIFSTPADLLLRPDVIQMLNTNMQGKAASQQKTMHGKKPRITTQQAVMQNYQPLTGSMQGGN